MYVIKQEKVPRGFMGKSTLSDSEYKMLSENIKHYYRKYEGEVIDFDAIKEDTDIGID